MALTKEERDALPDSDFAVPGKRKLPMHDEKHVRMGWDMLTRTEGLTDAERTEGRRRLINRAKELGIDTTDWSTIKAMSLEAMSLVMPDGEHPNKMPFSGVLVVLDQPSDLPPHGSGGRRIIMTTAAAKKAIPTLLGMGVNYTQKLDGHDQQKKIGIISDADVKDGGIHIEGFIYASDFPDAAARIRADKKVLGFSFEATDIKLADPGADPLEIKECVFTGAAILRKDKAAFMSTSLAAHAESQTQEIEMTPEELKAAIAAAVGDAMKPTNDRLAKIEAAQTEAPKLAAKAHTESMVEPHAKALEACADGMEAAGIGGHAQRGHVAIARKMASTMRASAAMGQIPHIFQTDDFYRGSSDTGASDVKKELDGIRTEMKAAIDGLGTKFTDLAAKAFNASAAPERKTISAEVTALLAKGGLTEAAEKGSLTVEQVDKMLDAQNLTGTARIEAKLKLMASGVLKQAA